MPIHDQSYRHWEGTFSTHAFRWWVITREGLRIILRRKLFLIFILGPPVISFLVYAIIIYVANVYEDILQLKLDERFFFSFFIQQTFFIAIVCVFGGSGLIANDLKNNALQLYFSKPLTHLDYLVGKLAIIMVLMGFITLVPGILLFTENAVLSGSLERYWILGSIVSYSLILTVSTGLLILALSSVAKSNRYAAISFIAILIGTPIFSEVLEKILKLRAATFISYWSNLNILGRQLFSVPSRQDWYWGVYDWYWAMLIIFGIIELCIWIMHRKIKGVEIVK